MRVLSMSWRRGEMWLVDNDVPWLREGDLVPAVAGLEPVRLPRFTPDPGLLASRERRTALKRRRRSRRARATAVVLSPALLVALAGLRNDRDLRLWRLADDPPSETVRLGDLTGSGVSHLGSVYDRLDIRRAPATQVIAAAVAAPVIRWHHASSVGLPHMGHLVEGTQLPVSGPDWITWNPVTDSAPNLPNRLYGNERTIRAVLSVATAYRAAHPDAPRLVVGDISRKGGGPMTDEHVSHQNGLDVDIYFPRLDRRLRAPLHRSQIDRRLAQDLLDRFVAAGAQKIFVGHSTGLHGPAGIVVPYAGHEFHMHVRFPAPAA
jgi:penicillin-insensitive murein endopeptidase